MKINNSKLSSLYDLFGASSHFFRFLGVRNTLVLAGGALLFALLSMVNVVAFLPAISLLSDSSAGEAFGGLGGILGPLSSSFEKNSYILVSSIIAVSFIFKFLFGLVFSYTSGIYTEKYMNDLRNRLIGSSVLSDLKRKNFNSNDQIHFLVVVSRIGSLNWAFLNFLIRISISFVMLVLIIKLDYRGMFVLGSFGIVWSVILLPMLRKTRSSSDRYLGSLKALNKRILEDIANYQSILIYNQSNNKLKERRKREELLMKNNASTSCYKQAVGTSQELLIALAISFLVLLSPKLNIAFSEILSIGFLISRLSSSFNEAITFYSNAIEMLPAYDEFSKIENKKLEEVLLETWEFADRSTVNTEEKIKIIFDDFYPSCSTASPVNLSLVGGEKLKVCGANGAGKSTFLSTFLGFLEFKGNLKINNKSILKNGKYLLIKELISYVPQSASIQEGTVLENLFASKQDILNISKKTKIDLNAIIPNWESVTVQESGKNLSGGQKQVISLFRALLSPHEILVLDEFSNHLSKELKEKFIQFINNYYDEKVVMYVTHDSDVYFEGQKELWI